MNTFTPLGYSIAALSLCMSTLIAGICTYSVASAISSAVISPVHLLGIFSIVVVVSSIVYLIEEVIPSKNQDAQVGYKLPRSAAVFLLCASGLVSGGCIYPLVLVISNATIIQVLSAVVGSVCMVVALSSILHLLRSHASAVLKETTSTSNTVTFQESDLSPTFCSDKAGDVQFISSAPPRPTHSPPPTFPYNQTFASPDRNVNIYAQGIPYTTPTHSPPPAFPCNQAFTAPSQEQAQQQAKVQAPTQQQAKVQAPTQQQAKVQQQPVDGRVVMLKSIRAYSEKAGSRSMEQIENSIRIGKEKREEIDQSRQVKLKKVSLRLMPKWPTSINQTQAQNMVSDWTEGLRIERESKSAEAGRIGDKFKRVNKIQEIQKERLMNEKKSQAILESIKLMSPGDLTDAIVLQMIQGIVPVPPATVDPTSYVPPTHSETSTSSGIPLPPPMQETSTPSGIPLPPPMQETSTPSGIPLPPPMQETSTPSGMPTSSLLGSASLEAPFTPDPAGERSKEGNFQQDGRNFR